MAYKKYTAEDRAAFAEADAELADAAHRLLADPEEIERLVTHLITIRSPRVLRFSMRNQAMLINQARERGVTLTDLDTAKGWSQRGRSVRDEEREHPYRLTVPKGTETVDGDAADHDDQDHDDHGDGGEGKKTRGRFRTRTYYDHAQTEGFDDTMPGFRPSTVEDPQAVLREALADQLDRFGYDVVFDDVDTVEVNDDAEPPVIAVPADDPVIGMARALGSILSRPPKERPRQRRGERAPAGDAGWITDKPVGARRVVLDLGEFKTAVAWVIPHPESGSVVYKVTGRSLYGTWTVHSEDAANHDTITSATVQYGDYTGADYYSYGQAPGLPKVNGIELLGSCGAITPDRIAQLDRYRVRPRRSDDGGRSSREVPDKTADRTAAVVRAILTDFYARDDLDQLHQARARREAPHHRATAHRAADQLKRQIDALTADLDTATQDAARYGAIADTAQQD
ncbi:hypothetical protein [Amycolatopsis australiensis]|uniref:Uncharacterized protein n=1 Tax=Amycolatopsis australiensis TaxID=546364 RepID=A0A1K1LQH4_9PSEU|nr:hypothetical protein [Amycolatopsis australiensis]SFW13119.1 hypothetical protein SAMN04489730_0139 [Amycolatopsis australiensis]